MAKFKVGDRVRVTYSSEYWCGEGFVTFASNDNYSVTYDDGKVGGFYECNLRLADNSPVRTVTRREIETGRYGKLELFDDYSAEMTDWSDAEACRSAARIFNEIADVLDEQSAEIKKEAA